MNNLEIFPHVRRKSASKAESPEFAFDLSERELLERAIVLLLRCSIDWNDEKTFLQR